MTVGPMRKERLAAYAKALQQAVDASGLSRAEIIRQAVLNGAGTLSESNFYAQLKGDHKPNDPETVWALEVVLDCDGKLTAPLGLLPASMRTEVAAMRQAVTRAQQAAEQAGVKGSR